MNHIDEGLVLLQHIGGNERTMRAWCLHPLVQADDDLIANVTKLEHINPLVVFLAMEYRNVANQYLCRPKTDHYTLEDVPTPPLFEVAQMLWADKTQNERDFRRYHYDTHPRSRQLSKYFHNWLTHLEDMILTKVK
jgi:hypothetical protein